MTEHCAQLKFPCDPTTSSYYLHLFEGLFPKELVLLIIDKVNDNIDGEKVTYGEFLHWIGLWLLMSTADGTDRHSFWSTKEVNPFDGAPFHLTEYMTQCWFENILINLGFTKEDPPPFRDRLHVGLLEQKHDNTLFTQLDQLHR